MNQLTLFKVMHHQRAMSLSAAFFESMHRLQCEELESFECFEALLQTERGVIPLLNTSLCCTVSALDFVHCCEHVTSEPLLCCVVKGKRVGKL